MRTKQKSDADYLKLELHIGYVYGSDETPPHASHYKPKFVPGARLPHAWIKFPPGKQLHLPPEDVSYVWEFTPTEVEERRYSTLDLCDFNAFTLLAGSRSHLVDRFNAASELLLQWPFKFNLFASDSDFSFVAPAYEALFSEQGGLGKGEAILIRPDQHILARLGPNSSAEHIRDVICDHLGLS